MNSFYLKYLLWIDVAHPWVTIRVVSIFVYSVPAIRELYDYMNDPRYALRSPPRFVCGLTPGVSAAAMSGWASMCGSCSRRS